MNFAFWSGRGGRGVGWSLLLAWAAVLTGADARAAETLTRRTWTVAGVEREGLVHVPAAASERAVPLVFAFHGHGGTMRQAARSFSYHTLWPEALVVYLQGLNTPGRLTDPEGKKPGWQHALGEQGDRDLALFDAVLAELQREHRVDRKRTYATGHSNGGGFTYLLWAARGDVFAAVAPSGSVAARHLSQLKPKPVLHVAGEKDPLVKYEWQERTIETLLKLNSAGAGVPWAHGGKRHDSKTGTPVVAWVHPGGHEFPAAARTAIVAFFKEHTQP